MLTEAVLVRLRCHACPSGSVTALAAASLIKKKTKQQQHFFLRRLLNTLSPMGPTRLIAWAVKYVLFLFFVFCPLLLLPSPSSFYKPQAPVSRILPSVNPKPRFSCLPSTNPKPWFPNSSFYKPQAGLSRILLSTNRKPWFSEFLLPQTPSRGFHNSSFYLSLIHI